MSRIASWTTLFYKRSEPRLRLFYPLFAAVFLFLATGLVYRQVIEGAYYKEEQKRQSLRRILLPGPRGNLYDRSGALLVGNRPVFSAVVYLSELRKAFREQYKMAVKTLRAAGVPVDRAKISSQCRAQVLQVYLDEINRVLGTTSVIDPEALDRHFAQRLLMPYVLAYDLSEKDYARLLEAFPPESAIQIQVDSARYYPYKFAAAHALGYVGSTFDVSDENVPGAGLKTFTLRGKVGKAGLEKKLDERLRGFSGAEIWQVDPAGLHGKCIEKKFPAQGESITTSLDIELQLACERALGGRRGAVVILEVGTREVLAMASHPTYDLTELSPYIPATVYERINDEGGWLNRATQGLYPPGSPFKLITASAGLRAGILDAQTTVECTGYYRVGNRLCPCMKRAGHGELDLVHALSASCNPYFYDAAIAAGIGALAQEARQFGLGVPTGIDLPYEASAQRMCVPDPAWKKAHGFGSWTMGDTANTAIGQGYLLATPAQMACVAETIACGQFKNQAPTLLHDPLCSRAPVRLPERPLELSLQQYALIVQGMELCATEGLSRQLKALGKRIAAKTGTAQTYVQGKERDLAWWVGFAPIDNPKVALAIMVEEISDTDHFLGGLTGGAVALEIFKTYFKEHP